MKLPIFRYLGGSTAVLLQIYRLTNKKVPNKKGSLFGHPDTLFKINTRYR